MSIHDLWTWQNASWREAARLRHPEIDLDHLYLGLIAQGGNAAQVLGAHGLTLTSAREAVRDLSADELAGLGIDVRTLRQPPPRGTAQLHHGAVGDIPLSERAREFAVTARSVRTNLATLHALLDEPSGRVRRLLIWDGADPDAVLRTAAQREGSDRGFAELVEADPDLLPRPHRAVRYRQYVSAAPLDVAEVIADPEVLTSWAVESEDVVRGDGQVVLTRHGQGSRSMTLRWTVERSVEAHRPVVTWRQTITGGPRDGEPLAYDRFDLSPQGPGSEVTRTCGVRTWRLLGRLLGPVTVRLTGLGMPVAMQNIACAVADRG